MEPKGKSETTITTMIPKSPIKVKQATLQAETFWPGKIGAEVGLNPQKYPHMKMLWIDGRGLQLQWADGSLYTIPETNVKGFEHE